MKTSIIVPSYNEMRTLPSVLKALAAVPLEKEVVVVDDGSADGTREWLDGALAAGEFPFVKFIKHPRNTGKGGALITGFKAAAGDIIIVQDADLEYDPAYIPAIVKPIEDGLADAVYGSRLLISGEAKPFNIVYLWGNQFLTFLINLLFGAAMTDSYTCYKAFRAPLLKAMDLVSSGFEIEAEISCKTAARGLRFKEVPIVYASRSRADGKKINYKDAVKGVLKILWLRLTLSGGSARP
ncbi:MAG TPA: glycosyltransferase family 2 protein [Elusimicrobiales bacterium]|nr:glycosyltransferase family 2 protein [Elusimicrobiales bacterium]